MQGISYLELYNSNAGGSFTVNNWTSSDGLGLYLIGSSGPNTFDIGDPASPMDLTPSPPPSTVMATGGKSNMITLNDKSSSSYNDYTLSQNSITSTFARIKAGPDPSLQGRLDRQFLVHSPPTVIQTVNLDPDAAAVRST